MSAANLVTAPANRLAPTTNQEDTMTTLTETPAAQDATESTTYYLKVVVDETWSDEAAMKYLDNNIARFIDVPERVDVFEDGIGVHPCRDLGVLTYRPDTGNWNLARHGIWSVEDHRVAAQALRIIKRMGTPTAKRAFCTEAVTADGFPFLRYRIARPLADLRIHEVFKIALPALEPGSAASSVDPLDGTGGKITQDDVDLMFHCHDEALDCGEAEIASDPRPVEIFRCPKTNRIMRRIGVSRYDETTGKFLAVAFEGATGLDHARIWCAPSFSLEDKPLGADVLAATTIHTRDDGTRYADVSIARPLDDCNAEELAGIAHDLFELITNPDATAEGEWGENRVFLEVTA